MNPTATAALTQSKDHWFFRFKIYHLPFWFAYHFMWWALRFGSPMAVLSSLALPHAAFKFFFYLIFQAAGVYFNLYFLIPKYLERGRYFQYTGFLILTIITTAALVTSGYYIGAWVLNKPIQELYKITPNFFSLLESGSLPSTAASMTLAMSIKLTKKWIQSRRREQLLEKEKMETELKFLRAQFNPHFLFNTINSIFVLINKNQRMASEALAKFSDLLRYQLYECNEQQIPITKELCYVENFIDLQKLRQDGNVETTLQLDRPATHELWIAPFIVMPFVENAFKHVSQFKNGKNWIVVSVHFDGPQLQINIVNSVSSRDQISDEVIAYRGIGLKNVQRRLDLVYPNEYELQITDEPEKFHVSLKLNLTTKAVNVNESQTASVTNL